MGTGSADDDDRDTPPSATLATNTDTISTAPPPSEAGGPNGKVIPSTRSAVALLTAVTGLVTAIAAFRHVPEERTAKESYVVLQAAFTEQQAEIEVMKKEVVNLRGSLEAYVRAKEGDGNVVPQQGPPEALPPVEVHVRPTPPVAVSLAPTSAPPPPARVVVIASARPAAPKPTPLPDVNELANRAHAKD